MTMKVYNTYIKLVQKQKGKVIIGFILLILNAIITIRIPFLLDKVMDTLFGISDKGYFFFLKVFFSYVMLFYIQQLIGTAIALLFKKVGNSNTQYVSEDIVKRVIHSIKMEQSHFDFGNALVVLNSDCFQFAENGILLLFQMCELIINIFALFFYMWTTNSIMAIIVTILFVILSISQKYMNNKISSCIEKDREESEKHTRITNTIVEHKNAIYRDDSYEYISNRFEIILKDLLNVRYNMVKIMQSNQLINAFVIIMNMSCVFVLGSYFVASGEMSLGSLMTFNMFSSSFGSYITQIPNFFVQKKTFDTSCKRINKFTDTDMCEADKENNIDFPDILNLKDISFRYSDEQSWILRRKNFEFAQGRIYSIIGKNGVGKSTILKLISGEIPICEGDILINNEEVDLFVNKNIWDKYISYFSSDVILYNDTLLNNMTLNKEYSQDLLNYLLDMMDLSSWIFGLPNGLETQVDDLMLTLSDGQKQKIVLIRYLLNIKKVFLLDEVEKHIDEKTKKNIMKYLQKIKEDKIIIIATHDETILSYCDDGFCV